MGRSDDTTETLRRAPLKSAGGGGTVGGMETRVKALEDDVKRILQDTAEIKGLLRAAPSAADFGELRGRVNALPSASDFGDLKGRVNALPTAADFADLKGRVDALPTTARIASIMTIVGAAMTVALKWSELAALFAR